MTVIEPVLLSEPWNFTALYTNFNLIGSEVENARGTFDALVERETAQEERLSNLESAKGEFATLVEREESQNNRIANLELAKGNFDTLLGREDTQGNRISLLESEVVEGRQGEVSLLNALHLYLKMTDGFSQTIDANSHKLTGLGLGVNPNDSVTLSQVNAMLTLGGDPANVSILDLSTAGLEPGQNIETSSDGQNITGSQITVINASYQALAGQRLVVNANNNFMITLPQNPVPNTTQIDFVAFTGKIGQNNITLLPFGSDLIEGINQATIIRKNQALKFIFIGETTGWLKIEQSTAGASVDTPNGFANWYEAIKQPSIYNILKII